MAEDKGNFFVHRPIVAIVIAIVIVIIGSVSLIGLPIEQYPNLTPPIVQVRASYMGADAISVEESVATPLEQEIKARQNQELAKVQGLIIKTIEEIAKDGDFDEVKVKDTTIYFNPKEVTDLSSKVVTAVSKK